jgi:flagellar biogenesis protein FliO
MVVVCFYFFVVIIIFITWILIRVEEKRSRKVRTGQILYYK